MKFFNSKSLILIGFLGILIATGCSKKDFGVNKNPNSPTDSTITYSYLMASAQQNTAVIVATNWGWLQNWMGYWARSGSYGADLQEETYTVTTNFETSVWTNLYSNTFNYEIMRQKAHAAGATFYEGVARMMKAHNFALLVDTYGNIPYSQALQGNNNTTPKYDKGEDIYKDLFRQIDTAITMINATVASKNVDYLTNDLMYGTNSPSKGVDQLGKWNKFGNTLKLRLLIHAANVAGIDKNAEMAVITANGQGFLGTGESAMINPGYSASKPNPYYRTYVKDEGGNRTQGSQYYKANSYALGYYAYDGDVRRNYFYTSGSGGYIGVPYGLPPATKYTEAALAGVDGIGLLPTGATSPAWILTSVESKFLQAEAAFRGYLDPSTAKSLYTAAVEESFFWLGSTTATADAYLANNAGYADADFDATPDSVSTPAGLYAILSQKWFSLNAIAPFEVWTDYRRTDVTYGLGVQFTAGPPISVAPANTATQIPVRLFYPQTEYNYNGANVAGQGVLNAFNSKIFWDL